MLSVFGTFPPGFRRRIWILRRAVTFAFSPRLRLYLVPSTTESALGFRLAGFQFLSVV